VNSVSSVANAFAFIALTFWTCVCAAAYPAPPIRLVVPAAPGGAIDVVGHIVGLKLTGLLGQTIVVDNEYGPNPKGDTPAAP
jgi:tripartite-type tricarboxylate transporter receptor subunit TctC